MASAVGEQHYRDLIAPEGRKKAPGQGLSPLRGSRTVRCLPRFPRLTPGAIVSRPSGAYELGKGTAARNFSSAPIAALLSPISSDVTALVSALMTSGARSSS